MYHCKISGSLGGPNTIDCYLIGRKSIKRITRVIFTGYSPKYIIEIRSRFLTIVLNFVLCSFWKVLVTQITIILATKLTVLVIHIRGVTKFILMKFISKTYQG